jgi:5'-methylthioadenosine phosphorylase
LPGRPVSKTIKSSVSAIGVILGTGLYNLYSPAVVERLRIATKFGEADLERISAQSENYPPVYILLRHGATHSIPPHLINYRANISALREKKVSHIIATSSVGAINPKIDVGSYVLVDQFIDQTTKRTATMFGDANERFAHTDMTRPYAESVRSVLLKSLRRNRIGKIVARGTYVCTEGPRFETPAEIAMYRKLGGDVVGMTGVPEVILANELGIDYASLCFVTNMAAGMQKKISNEEVIVEMKKHQSRIKAVIDSAISELIASDV